jgi:hypothetical protein
MSSEPDKVMNGTLSAKCDIHNLAYETRINIRLNR